MLKYPKINIYSDKQLADRLSGKGSSFNATIGLIGDCLKNKDKYWHDNMKKSDPGHKKWFRSARGTPLGKLQELISERIFAPYDKYLPSFVHGGVVGKGIKTAANSLLGKKKHRMLLKIDMTRFFEHVSYDDVVDLFEDKFGCSPKVAKIIAEMSCVRKGPKGNDDASNRMVLARGFSASGRIAVWCNIDLFMRIFYIVGKKLKGHDPKMAIYMDDIGITASRVESVQMVALYKDILKLIGETNLEVNEGKTVIVDYMHRKYDFVDGSLCAKSAPFEFLGIELGRKKLFPGTRIRGDVSRLSQMKTRNHKQKRSLKGKKRFMRYVMRED